MKKKLVLLVTMFFTSSVLISCKASEKNESEESTTVSTTNDFWERFSKAEEEGNTMNNLPTNGGPSSREKDVIEGMEVPAEILTIASQNFDDYFLPEELVVENRSYHTSDGEESRIVVELLDNLKTKDLFTAYLNKDGQIEYYKFAGDSELYLYDFIEYFEKNDEITKSITETRLKKRYEEEDGPNFFKSYLSEYFEYNIDYDLYRGGIDRFIVEITYREKK